MAAAALELGPIGFVLKHSGGQELLKAIERVLHGLPASLMWIENGDYYTLVVR
jgi:DNA-binding NarL/FixJ family response regulator